VEGLASGRVDICIGTHRLIQKDVRFKDLGLVIIDEEQRFGVAHKERLKQMRREVDVLTSTATPIPRTLHMSLAGVRDMSTMETPPEERLPIKTYVSEFSDELIREAVLRELDRQGQVYFLHNRVHNIDYMAAYIERMVPEATVGVAHGQMPEGQLELTMTEFAEGKMDVLVCTTIIESGLDIPNVNTLIINRADTFGLSQLYQLRGRVGRSARRAYAYLLVPEARSLTEPAEKRLRAMLGATELGSGFRIAMKDLEIRGAGNILGSQQSGYIHAVGFDLYTRLLSTAVEDLRAQVASGGTGPQADGAGVDPEGSEAGPDGAFLLPLDDALSAARRTTVELGVPSSISDDYVTDLTTRIGIYQRLVKLEAVDDVDDMETELRDRFGELPWQARNLLYVVRLKLRAQAAGVESITRQDRRIVLRLEDQVGGARQALQRALGRGVTVGNSQIRLDLDQAGDQWEDRLAQTVDKLAAFRERLMAGVQATPTS
jgi:transcription-repair coupling factor (superfamily II helicase)